VELTDVYKEAHVVDQPLDLNSMIAYPAPYPGAEGAVVTSRLEAPGNSLIASTKNVWVSSPRPLVVAPAIEFAWRRFPDSAHGGESIRSDWAGFRQPDPS
jgi:hypothetical protein